VYAAGVDELFTRLFMTDLVTVPSSWLRCVLLFHQQTLLLKLRHFGGCLRLAPFLDCGRVVTIAPGHSMLFRSISVVQHCCSRRWVILSRFVV
jgi:hypothetical protein